jgi:sec-independent protein translocase protein TatC
MVEEESELSEHLDELRARIVRCLIYVTLGAIAGWILYKPWIYGFITAPVTAVFKGKFLMTHIAEPFVVQFEVALITGVMLAVPLITFEIWGFISPGLTKEEKRPVRWFVPLCAALFAMGVAVAYLILPAGVLWFKGLVPENAELRPTAISTVTFIAKMLLAFGIVFEMPVVLLLLAKLGIVDSKLLKSKWRHSVVIISVIAAVATPSSDAFSMLAMAIPLVILYGLSIFLVKMVEPKGRS